MGNNIICDPESFGDIVICAVRYACGRRMYITRTVTQFGTMLFLSTEDAADGIRKFSEERRRNQC